MTELLSGADLQRVERAVHEQVSQGVPAELSARSCALLDEFSLLDVAELADDLGQPVQRIADVHFAISDVFGLDWMLTRISRLPRMNRWEALARGAMRDDLYGAWMGLTKAVLGAGRDDEEADATERIQAWVRANESQIARARLTLDEVAAMPVPDLSSMSVALRVLRSVIRSASTVGH
jgi:glutamate dehydrogenase